MLLIGIQHRTTVITNMLGTGHICSLKPGFVITGLDNLVSLDLGLKKLKKYVRYNRKFVITEFVITEFHCF